MINLMVLQSFVPSFKKGKFENLIYANKYAIIMGI